MKVYFVMGPTGAGKSTYIKNYLPKDSIIIDIYKFQEEILGKNRMATTISLLMAEERCVNALINAIKSNKDKPVTVVLEHTMYANTRKELYLRAAKGAGAETIEGICIYPNRVNYIKKLNEKLPDISSGERKFYLDCFKNFESPPNGWFDKLTFVI